LKLFSNYILTNKNIVFLIDLKLISDKYKQHYC